MEVRPSLIILLVLSALTWAIAGDVWGPDSQGGTATKPPVVTAGVSRPTLPSPRPSPGAIVTQALDEFGRVLLSASPMPVAMPAGSPLPVVLGSPLLTTDLDSNGSTNVTTGAGVALLVPAAGGAATVGGTANGVYVQGKDATDDAVSANPLLAGARTWGVSGVPASVSANGDAVPILADGFGRLRIIAEGAAAHDSAISQAPVRIAGRARTSTDYTAVSADDVADLATTRNGQLKTCNDANSDCVGTSTVYTANEAGGSTAVAIKNGDGVIYGICVSNPNTTDVYLQLFNTVQASVTVGTTTPLRTYCIPGGTGSSNRGIYDCRFDPPVRFSTGMSYALTTTSTGSSAPSSSNTSVIIDYK